MTRRPLARKAVGALGFPAVSVGRPYTDWRPNMASKVGGTSDRRGRNGSHSEFVE
jgi:hypothetical protein